MLRNMVGYIAGQFPTSICTCRVKIYTVSGGIKPIDTSQILKRGVICRELSHDPRRMGK